MKRQLKIIALSTLVIFVLSNCSTTETMTKSNDSQNFSDNENYDSKNSEIIMSPTFENKSNKVNEMIEKTVVNF